MSLRELGVSRVDTDQGYNRQLLTHHRVTGVGAVGAFAFAPARGIPAGRVLA